MSKIFKVTYTDVFFISADTQAQAIYEASGMDNCNPDCECVEGQECKLCGDWFETLQDTKEFCPDCENKK